MDIQGNHNRFDTDESCMEACRGTPKVTRSGPFISIQEPGKQEVSTLPIRVKILDGKLYFKKLYWQYFSAKL